MDPGSYSFLGIEVRDGIAFVVLNRPDRENRFDPTQRRELHRLPGEAARDPAIRVLVFTGAGDHFSGGADHGTDPFQPFTYFDRSRDFMGAWVSFPKPTIMAVNGPARGLGLTFALLGDIIVLERHVTILDSHVGGGIAAATGPWLWPLSTGLGRAKRHLLTGDELTAEQAEEIGLVTEVVDPGSSLARATEYATRLAGLRPEAVQATKRALNQWLLTPFRETIESGLALEFMTFPPGRYAGSGQS
jgi:enoyl-CoA hydratase/carnithine racemase